MSVQRKVLQAGLGVIIPIGVDLLRSRPEPNSIIPSATGLNVPIVGADPLALDITRGETYQFDSDITTHPIESGGLITDHIDNLPVVLTLDVLITSTPAQYFQFVRNLLGSNDPSQFGYDQIKMWREEKRLLTVTVGFDVFDSMAIASWTPVRQVPAKRALSFTLTLQQVRIVDSESTLLDAASSGIADGLKGAVEGGKKAATDLNCTGLMIDLLQSIALATPGKSRAAASLDNLNKIRACYNSKQ